MDRAALDRELDDHIAGTRFSLASESDDLAIRQLLQACPMRGAVNVTFERNPNYFHGVDLAGGIDQTIVAYSGAELACMGRCTRRQCWIDGKAQEVGYLAELRLAQEATGRFTILRNGYAAFHNREANPASLYFTSIGADNYRARRFLERGLHGLPIYSYLSDLDTLLVQVPRGSRRARLELNNAKPEHIPELVRLLNGCARRFQLATVWTEDSLGSLARRGLPTDRILIAKAGGKITACAALWDQRSFRQTVIHGYARSLTIARPFLNLASYVLGTSRLPKPGSMLAHAFVSPLAISDAAEFELADLIEAVIPFATKLDLEFLTLALPAGDDRLPSLRKCFSTRSWRSRIYRVDWPRTNVPQFSDAEKTFLPDVALL